MKAHSYLLERAPAPGCSAHYALRVAPKRMQALALYVLLRELDSILAISDDSVAHAKLAWWRQELAHLAPSDGATNAKAAAPSHPLTQALFELGYASHAAVTQFQMMADAVEIDLTQSRFLDDLALNRYLALAAGAPAAALAIAAGLPEPAQNQAARLGQALGRARLLMETGRHARQKRIYLPHQLLKQFDVPAADVLQARVTPALALLGASESGKIKSEANEAVAALSRQQRHSLRALVVYAALTLARLDEVARDGYRFTLHRISLTPVRKLLLAWQTAYFSA